MKPKKDPRSGVALILVMVSVAFMTIIIVEVIAASRVDLRIAINARNRLQAHYLAVSGAKLQLLRLHMYKEVRNLKDGSQNIPISDDMIDKIWNVPMPSFPLDGTKSTWPGQMMGSVSSEGSKIPINLLDGSEHRGSSVEIAESVKKQITSLIEGLLETEEFDEKYRGLEPKDLLNPLVDWIDANKDRVEGGDEDREYDRLDPPYRSRNDRMPSLSELHLVQGWTDDLIRRIAPNFSVLNIDTKVNPNYVSLSRIKTWGPSLTEAELAAIDQHRRLTPFGSMTDLENFVRSDPEIRGGDNFTIPEELKDSKNQSARERVFHIEASGVVANVRRNLRLGVILLDEKKKGKTKADRDKEKVKLLEPQVVFVEEYL
jgi:general secretion pathway protein K